MPIPQTALDQDRLIEQAKSQTIRLQLNINQNAVAHRGMALAQSVPLGTLQTFVAETLTAYEKRQKELDDWIAVPQKRAAMVAELAKRGWTLNDITQKHGPLVAAVAAFKAAPKTSYAEIVAACDALIAEVQAPESLWPE